MHERVSVSHAGALIANKSHGSFKVGAVHDAHAYIWNIRGNDMSTLKPGHSSHTDKDGNLIQIDIGKSRVKYTITDPDGLTAETIVSRWTPRTEDIREAKEKTEKALHKKKNGY